MSPIELLLIWMRVYQRSSWGGMAKCCILYLDCGFATQHEWFSLSTW